MERRRSAALRRSAGGRGDSRALPVGLLLSTALLGAACDEPAAPDETAAQVTQDPAAVSVTPDPAAGAEDITAWHAWELEGTARPTTLLAAVADPDRMLQLMDDAHDGGTSGFYLREIGGSVLLEENESFVFEPASTIKALVHFHAMRQVQDGATIDSDVVTLTRQIQNAWATPPGSSCPQAATPFSATLRTGLRAMMFPSDNPWTQALRDFFGDTEIDDTRQDFDMTNSLLQHRIGCGGDALANPNRLTLVDAGKMYEDVVTGFLTGATRDTSWAIMDNDTALFNTMIDEEVAGLGLSSTGVNDFKAELQTAMKAGSYTLNSLLYRSVAGWSELGFKNSSCALAPREYVYGAFIHKADALTGLGIRALGVETFREQVREGLETWADCEADLRVFSAQAIGLGAPLNVNEEVAFTVRQTVRNDGPAESVDAVLTTTITGPADCTIDPVLDTQPVADLGGESVEIDIPVTMTCASPSHHVFEVTAAIEPENSEIVDPNADNDTITTFVSRELIAHADLGITDWDFIELDDAGLGDFMVAEMFPFETTKTVQNFGDTELGIYHDPADVQVSRSFAVPEGVRGRVTIGTDETMAQVVIQRQGEADQVFNNVMPGTDFGADGAATIIVNFQLSALAVDETRQVIEAFGVECLEPGEQTLRFANAISAVDPHLLDPVPDNDELEIERSIECVLPVQLNIRPGNQHNRVNPGSHQNVPTAILTTGAGEYDLPLAFDATTIDPGSTRFGTLSVLGTDDGSPVSQNFVRDSFEMDDKTKDGDLDRVLHFGIVGTGADPMTTELCVTGQFLGNGGMLTFLGCDAVDPNGPGAP